MDILIYTRDSCPYCVKAKAFFNKNNLQYSEKKVGVDLTSEEYRQKINTTVPSIYIDGNFIGGYDDLMWLNSMKPEMFSGR